MAAELQLIVDSAPSHGDREMGWMRATLRLAGEPYWYGEDEQGSPAALDWTWIDLLHYLGKNWSALMLEQSYPLPLKDLPHPGKLWQRAEARWENMPEAKIHAEESQVMSYLDRHNLAMALSGANVPMLLWSRSGSTLWLVDEDDKARRACFTELARQLESIGDTLSDYFSESSQPHVQKAVTQWQRREQQLQKDYLAYSTGFDTERLATLQAMVSLDVPAQNAESLQEPAYLAAARMTRHHLTTEQIAKIIRRVKSSPATGKQPFSALLQDAEARLEELLCEPPFEQGYQLARWLRAQLGIQDGQAFDPQALLAAEGVTIDEYDLESADIDAIACWGAIDPLILLNRNANARSARANGRRATLAHEICHLLIDRTRALPVAEVLGGEVDDESEKRANAFAAELLLPQAHAITTLQTAPTLDDAVENLAKTHKVGRQLAAYQLLNATEIMFSEDDRIALRNYGVRA